MTYRAVGIPDLIELLRMPQIRDKPIITAADLAASLEVAADAKWRTGQSGDVGSSDVRSFPAL